MLSTFDLLNIQTIFVDFRDSFSKIHFDVRICCCPWCYSTSIFLSFPEKGKLYYWYGMFIKFIDNYYRTF